MLSDSDDNDDIHQFTINEHYAKAFQYKKEREELSKLKDKYGSDAELGDDGDESTDSESAESEDEDGEELTPAVDAAILRTLAKIKNKDPSIYEKDVNVFAQEHDQTAKDSAKFPRAQRTKNAEAKSKPYTIRQAALDSALLTTSRSPSPEPAVISHAQEQETLRRETVAAFHLPDSEDEEDAVDDFLVPRAKTQDEIERDERDYQGFLKSQVGEEELAELVTIEDVGAKIQEEDAEEEEEESSSKKKKKKKKEKKEKGKATSKSKEEEDRDFLLSYILNRGWIDRSANRIPTWGEVTGHPEKTKSSKSKSKSKADPEEDDEPGEDEEDKDGVDEENEFDDIVDDFESSYNFRFEEPDAGTIKRYPRDLASTVRREDTTRKDARQRKKERKQEELMKKKEEVKMLKALKMKEIRAKLDKIGKEGGLGHDPLLDELDLEGDWDPDAHDKQMFGLYAGDDVDGDDEGFVDSEKPTWDDDISIGDVEEWDIDDGLPKASSSKSKKTKKNKKKNKGAEEDEDMAVDIDEMDADAPSRGYDDDEEEWDGTEEMRKRKLDEYMNELYSMDFNDMVGDMPTRFKYTTVKPTNYGLAPAEILMATDAELNEYMGIKKFAPYKKGDGWDPNRGAKLGDFKKKLAERSGGAGGTGANATQAEGGPMKKRMGKKERMKLKGAQNGAEEEDGATTGGKRKRDSVVPDEVPDMEKVPADQGGDGASGKRKRRRKRKGGEGEAAAA